VAAEETRKAQLIVIALDQTIADLRTRGEAEWQEQIDMLTRMRQDTIARVYEIDPASSSRVPVRSRRAFPSRMDKEAAQTS
jgi:hypothetical protein